MSGRVTRLPASDDAPPAKHSARGDPRGDARAFRQDEVDKRKPARRLAATEPVFLFKTNLLKVGAAD